MRKVKYRWRKKQIGRVFKKMLVVVKGGEGLFIPVIMLNRRYSEWIKKYRNRHKYYDFFWVFKNLDKYKNKWS